MLIVIHKEKWKVRFFLFRIGVISQLVNFIIIFSVLTIDWRKKGDYGATVKPVQTTTSIIDDHSSKTTNPESAQANSHTIVTA